MEKCSPGETPRDGHSLFFCARIFVLRRFGAKSWFIEIAPQTGTIEPLPPIFVRISNLSAVRRYEIFRLAFAILRKEARYRHSASRHFFSEPFVYLWSCPSLLYLVPHRDTASSFCHLCFHERRSHFRGCFVRKQCGVGRRFTNTTPNVRTAELCHIRVRVRSAPSPAEALELIIQTSCSYRFN